MANKKKPKVFSKRVDAPELSARNVLNDLLRRRLLQTISRFVSHWGRFLREMEDAVVREYGELAAPGFIAARTSDNPVEEHFFSCTDAHAFDFIELAFRTSAYNGGQDGVEEINDIFREVEIGFELTPLHEKVFSPRQRRFTKTDREVTQYPSVIPKNDSHVYEEVIQPCMEVLGDERFETASSEFRDAMDSYRANDFHHAITSCASAIESVLKTICSINGWPCDPDKDGMDKLLETCKQNDLFPGYYKGIIQGVGTIRNKLGSAHGRGPDGTPQLDAHYADHCIALTAANILLLVRLGTRKV